MAEVKVLGKVRSFAPIKLGYASPLPAHDFLAPKTELRELGQHRDQEAG
jgi:hypothetical protein